MNMESAYLRRARGPQGEHSVLSIGYRGERKKDRRGVFERRERKEVKTRDKILGKEKRPQDRKKTG